MDRHIKAPLNDDEVKMLKAGDYVYISGTIYTARDAAHKRMYEALQNGQEVPMPLKNNIVYYMGPSPAREGRPIGSAGPTTSSRMDKYAPLLMDQGLKGMIGKGKRSAEVREAIVRNGAVYFAAVGGAGALLSKAVKKAEVIAYDDLGTEAIRKLEVENLPAIVVIDSEGSYLYEDVAKKYRKICNKYVIYLQEYVIIKVTCEKTEKFGRRYLMNKKLISIVTIMAMLVVMIIPAWADGGDNTGDDNFGAAIYVKKDGVEGAYTLGTAKEFKLEFWASGIVGKQVVRTVSVTGDNQVSSIEYKDGGEWYDISGFNKEMTIASNDLDRTIRVVFDKEGRYTISYGLVNTEGQDVVKDQLNIEIADGQIKIVKETETTTTATAETTTPAVVETTTPVAVETTTTTAKTTTVAPTPTTTAKVTTTQKPTAQKVSVGNTRITKIVKTKKSAKVIYKKIAKVSGYQLQLSRSSKFKKAVTKTTKKISYKFKNLKANKKYYVRVRGYVKTSNGTAYGKWRKKNYIRNWIISWRVITKRVWMGNYFRYWSAWMSAGKKLVLPTKNVCGNMFATH